MPDTEPRWVDTGSGPGFEVSDGGPPEPDFAPAASFTAVQQILRARGIMVDPADGGLQLAQIVAAELLRSKDGVHRRG